MRRIKVCFVSPGSYALFNPEVRYTFGGAEVQIYLLATRLARVPGFDVSCIIGDFGQPEEESREGVRLIKGMVYEKRNLWNFISPANKIAQWRAMKRAGADIYVVRTASALVGLTRMLSSAMGKKLVYMAANDIDCNGQFERSSNILVRRLYRHGLQRADRIIVQSDQQKSMLEATYSRNSTVIRSGYELKRTRTVRRKHILWVGRCDASKDPLALIQIAESFPGERFVLIGPKGEDEMLFERVCNSLPPNVLHLPFVPFKDIGGYFRSAKLFVNTSRYEGFPNTFIQSCLEGTPIISLNVNPDSIFSKGIGYFAEGDRRKLDRNLARLLSDRKAWTRASKACLRYVKENHDINDTVTELAKAFRGIAG